MGAVAGPEVGLASGVLNTARQLGAAIGVALLIATFGGALHAHMAWFADDKIEDAVDEWEIPGPLAGQVVKSTLHDYTGGTSDRFKPEPGFDEAIIRQTAGSAREGFAWAFRHAALLILSVIPLLGALKRTPAQARAEFMAQMQAQQAAGDAPPDPGPKPDPDPEPEPHDGDGAMRAPPLTQRPAASAARASVGRAPQYASRASRRRSARARPSSAGFPPAPPPGRRSAAATRPRCPASARPRAAPRRGPRRR